MKYEIIYGDPPWPNTHTRGTRGADKKFPLMSISDICQVGIKEHTAKNAILFLWTPAIFLAESLQVIESWGFKYKTMGFVWIKTTKAGKPAWGLGSFTRANAEFCLIGVKGKPKVQSHSISQVILEPRSIFGRKPASTRTKIVELMGDLPRIELFAREKTEGWSVWGNEVKSDVDLRG